MSVELYSGHPSFDFQYYLTYKMVYNFDSMHFNFYIIIELIVLIDQC